MINSEQFLFKVKNGFKKIFTKENVQELKNCENFESFCTKLTGQITAAIVSEVHTRNQYTYFIDNFIQATKYCFPDITKRTSFKIDDSILGLKDFEVTDDVSISQQTVSQEFFKKVVSGLELELDEKETFEIRTKFEFFLDKIFDESISKEQRNIEEIESKTKLFSNYLKDVVDFTKDKLSKEEFSISQYYVEPTLKLMPKHTWILRSDSTVNEGKDFVLENFVNGDKKNILIVAGSFGMGKSSLCKKWASDYAVNFMNTKKITPPFIPILIELHKNGLEYSNIRGRDETISSFLGSLYIGKESEKRKILLLIDIQQDYEGTLTNLMSELKTYEKYVNLKAVIFSRLEYSYFEDVLDDYVRLQYFSESQIDTFFDKDHYHIPELNYKALKEYNLEHEDICKPLFCWMIAQLYKKHGKLAHFNPSWTPEMRKTALYFEFIYGLNSGKVGPSVGTEKNIRLEKKVLQEIAAIRQRSTERINAAKITKIIQQQRKQNRLEYEEVEPPHIDDVEKNEDVEKSIEYILKSYFLQTESESERIDFIHPSFKDYLLAEYIMEKIRQNKSYLLNFPIPNHDCIDFIYGWCQLFTDEQTTDYLNKKFIEFRIRRKNLKDFTDVGEKTETVQDIRSFLPEKCIREINRNTFLIPRYSGRTTNEMASLSYEDSAFIWLHKWISLIMLNGLPGERRKNASMEKLLKTSSHLVPPFYKKLRNFDFKNADLSGVDFSGADVTGADFTNADLKGANFSNAYLLETVFIDANLSNTNFTNAKVLKTNFEGADLSNSDFGGAKISHGIFIDCILSQVNFSGSKFIEDDSLPTLGNNINNIPRSSADFSGSFILHCNLDNTKLDEVSFNGALLLSSDLSSAKLQNTKFHDTAIVNVEFYNSNLSNAEFIETTIEKVSFEKAILNNAEFKTVSSDNSKDQDEISTAKIKDFRDIDEEIKQHNWKIDEILQIPHVRFAAIINSSRQPIHGKHKQDVEELLSYKDKTILIHVVSVNRLLRRDAEPTLGDFQYVVTRFEKLQLITIKQGKFTYVVTTETDVDYKLILNKILDKEEHVIDVQKIEDEKKMWEEKITESYQLREKLNLSESVYYALLFNKKNGNAKILSDKKRAEFEKRIEFMTNDKDHMWRRWRSRFKFEEKIGKPLWVIMGYENYLTFSYLIGEEDILKLVLNDDDSVKDIIKSIKNLETIDH